jgi:hypothetical protein
LLWKNDDLFIDLVLVLSQLPFIISLHVLNLRLTEQ